MQGPIWGDSINEVEFIRSLYQTLSKNESKVTSSTTTQIKTVLSGILQEDESNVANNVLGVNLNDLQDFLMIGKRIPINLLRRAFVANSFSLARSYILPDIWKTNAPFRFFVDVLRSWRRMTSPTKSALSGVPLGTKVSEVLQRTPNYSINFTRKPGTADDSIDAKDFTSKGGEVPRKRSRPNLLLSLIHI
eukprot:TRINITY_DN10863_c0_g1_i3.p1 TRINITY_DN10863_c0_g1~~TRINITY_DN10863_c0_g1_i3.p1  ORF type:complete len:191 (-),score=11.66 TRINITY_DN10863_c0_g1_i3:60-632(-)